MSEMLGGGRDVAQRFLERCDKPCCMVVVLRRRGFVRLLLVVVMGMLEVTSVAPG